MRILVCILMSVAMLISCNTAIASQGGKEKGNGQLTSTEIQIDDYNSIDLRGNFDLIYEQKTDQKPYLRIDVDKNLQEYISTTVVDGLLTIKSNNKISSKYYKVYTNSTALLYLSFSGMNKIELRGSIHSENFRIIGSGRGKINIENIHCRNLDISMSGLAGITLAGEATNAQIEVSGKGSIHAYNLVTKNADCSVSGVGTINVYATETLVATVSGIGNINYKGDPKEKSLSKSGIGRIKAK